MTALGAADRCVLHARLGALGPIGHLLILGRLAGGSEKDSVLGQLDRKQQARREPLGDIGRNRHRVVDERLPVAVVSVAEFADLILSQHGSSCLVCRCSLTIACIQWLGGLCHNSLHSFWGSPRVLCSSRYFSASALASSSALAMTWKFAWVTSTLLVIAVKMIITPLACLNVTGSPGRMWRTWRFHTRLAFMVLMTDRKPLNRVRPAALNTVCISLSLSTSLVSVSVSLALAMRVFRSNSICCSFGWVIRFFCSVFRRREDLDVVGPAFPLDLHRVGIILADENIVHALGSQIGGHSGSHQGTCHQPDQQR